MRAASIAGAIALTACVTLGGVERAPGRETAADLLLEDYRCRDVDGQAPCEAGEQPAEVTITTFDCRSLPLRSGVREAARARCVFEGEIVRVNGDRDPIAEREREFSLIELTPGVRVPTRKWTLGKVR